ncbi:DUF2867 domain-containing protein [Kribbella turkmenica]|uniref:DUF2867 domain-containing protein n=1 Tax=Kribbella turkmenica TaxID=2530375 RepID=A0A4R4XD19_9ACTN|nr:DUF2867 domain-containing protein [Kribbella turkmenica]TDD28651.1 DUF2867 domain-containing protein [Kribbella turkmenica]
MTSERCRHRGRYRGQLAVLVRPNGRLGRLYMAAILPFRHLFVYPPLLNGIGKEWAAQADLPAREPSGNESA